MISINRIFSVDRINIVKSILERNIDYDTLVIYDLESGNDFRDLLSLIIKAEEEGDRFACGHIRPFNGGLGIWALDVGIVKKMVNGEKKDLLDCLLDFDGLEICCISQRIDDQ